MAHPSPSPVPVYVDSAATARNPRTATPRPLPLPPPAPLRASEGTSALPALFRPDWRSVAARTRTPAQHPNHRPRLVGGAPFEDGDWRSLVRGRGYGGSAPPRSQRASRGEEAAAARRGHFVSAAAARAQDGGGGRVSGRRPPRPREFPPSPFPLPALSQAPRGPLLLFSGERRTAAQGGGRPPEGPGWS